MGVWVVGWGVECVVGSGESVSNEGK